MEKATVTIEVEWDRDGGELEPRLWNWTELCDAEARVVEEEVRDVDG